MSGRARLPHLLPYSTQLKVSAEVRTNVTILSMSPIIVLSSCRLRGHFHGVCTGLVMHKDELDAEQVAVSLLRAVYDLHLPVPFQQNQHYYEAVSVKKQALPFGSKEP